MLNLLCLLGVLTIATTLSAACGDGGSAARDPITSTRDAPDAQVRVRDDDAPSEVDETETGASEDDGHEVVTSPDDPAGAAVDPAMADPPKDGKKYGDWTYHEVAGAVCRDGSPAGYYIRAGKSQNLMIFLNGGGVCSDAFFCGINPPNVKSSLPGENLLAAVVQIGAQVLVKQRQQPTETGIFKRDEQNPVGDWSMVWVPYCTGDVYGGTKRDASVPGTKLPPQQFVGYHNVGLFLEHFGPRFKGMVDKVLLTGSSAGGFGTLLNFDRTQEYFGDDAEVVAVTDSGIAFRDPFLEPCLQKQWRALWGLDAALPKDCKGCFDPSGGGLAQGLGDYLFRVKYPDRMIGGGISSKQDEIIKLFFSTGLNDCKTKAAPQAVAMFLGGGNYPKERYPAGLKDFLESVAGLDRAGSYILEGKQHQHIFRPRFYSVNGLGTSMADWLGKVLDGEPAHVGTLP